MDRYELIERAGIDISEEDYAKIEVVYLNSSDLGCVGDVVNYIKAHKGIGMLLERYKDAIILANVRANEKLCGARIRELNEKNEELVKKIDELNSMLEVYRSMVDKDDLATLVSKDDIVKIIVSKGVNKE